MRTPRNRLRRAAGVAPSRGRRPPGRIGGGPQYHRQKISNNNRPISMLDSPRKRIWPSLRRSALVNTSRQVVGLRNGSTPSNTSISATAPSSKSTIAVLLAARRRGGWRGQPRAAHRLEEFARRVDHHHIASVAKTRAVGFEAAIELRELRVAAERIGIQRRRLGIALALELLRVPVGFGDDHLALAIGVGANA